jgi:DNA polymerase-3 subunit delta'
MQREVFVPKSSMMQKKWVRLWVEWLLDIVKSGNISLDLSTRVSLQLLLVEALDILRIPVDLGLFLDHLYNQIRKVVDIDENG